uniref:Uncharacterized protein n=1 Tax=uncultured marine virus TaxID=186617 RepID=A0A0F7L3E1_9VIRU|nr:hypothetical protein [uncultured marine virus]
MSLILRLMQMALPVGWVSSMSRKNHMAIWRRGSQTAHIGTDRGSAPRLIPGMPMADPSLAAPII